MNNLLQWWVGRSLPMVHVRLHVNHKKFFYDLVIHPVKRRVAKCYVFLLQKIFGLTVIGITGSAGKTTTKEMLAGILKLDNRTVYSFDNIDPVFNIPTTILRCTPFTKYLILEMGIEYPNEMDFYLWLVRPKIGVITNIFPTHTLYLKNVEGVFREKSKLVKNTEVAVLNADSEQCSSLRNKHLKQIYWFNNSIDSISSNANAARKVAEVLNIDSEVIEKGLKNYESPKHRLQILNHKSGAVIFDDTYNSNPEAFLSSLKSFNSLAGKNSKIAIIGDMLELGEIEIKEHKRIGKAINKSGFIKVFGVGKLVKYITSDIYTDSLELVNPIKSYLKPKNYIFLKGSRSIGLDKLVDAILK